MTTKESLCRLCYRESDNLTNIYTENGIIYDCERKINKYLYLQVLKSFKLNDSHLNNDCVIDVYIF